MDEKILKYLAVYGIGNHVEDATTALESAADVCKGIQTYLEHEQPYAKETIAALEHAADCLRSCVSQD